MGGRCLSCAGHVDPLVLQPHLSHRDDGSLMYGTRDSELYLSEVKDLAQNDKLNDTLFISAVVVLRGATEIVR